MFDSELFYQISEQERYRKDFVKFFRKVFELLNPSQAYLHNWHVDCLGEYIQACYDRDIKRLIINIPPRTLKSSLLSIAFPAWGLGLDPSLQFMCVSYADSLATDLSVKSRQIVNSPWYKEIFPDLHLLKDQNQKGRFDTMQNGYRYATSTNGGATGHGANFLIVDDYLSMKMSASDQERETAINNFDPVFRTRLNNPDRDVIIIVEQRLHEKDLTGAMLKKEGFEHLCLQSQFEKRKTISIGGFKKTVESGELLHKERLSGKILDELRTSLGSQQFAGQYQQNPTAAGGNIIKLNWFKRYSQDLLDHLKFDTIVASLDTAYKQDQLNDPSAIIIAGFKDDNVYILDVINERFEYPDLKRKILSILEFRNPDWVLIEDKASGQSLVQEFQQETPYSITPIKPEANKIVRLHNCSAIVEAGRVFLPEKASWLFEFEEQITKFPKTSHDDMCFAADTLIATNRGNIPIEKLLNDDLILTPFGFFPIVSHGKTGVAKTINKLGLKATSNHKVFTFNNDFVEMDRLKQFHNLSKLTLCDLIRTTLLKLLNSTELNIDEWEEVGDTTCLNPLLIKEEGVLKVCMLQFMNLIAERKFRKAFMFIIKMVTHSTIALKTWSFFQLGNITRSLNELIWKNKLNILSRLGTLLLNGIGVKRVGSGIGSMLKLALWPLFLIRQSSAGIARRSLNTKTLELYTAQGTVSTKELTKTYHTQSNVSYVMQNSQQSWTKQSSVHRNVRTNIGRSTIEKEGELEDVYNIKVERIPLYYANNTLVHNCDAFSQLLNWSKNRSADLEFFSIDL